MECDTCARDTAAPAAFAKYCAAETRKAADAGDYPASPIRPHAFRALRPRPCDACGKTKCVACYRECRLCHKIVCVACVSAKPYLFRKDLSACERTSCPNDCSDRGICYTQKQLATVWKSNLRHAGSSRRPPRHRRDACSMA